MKQFCSVFKVVLLMLVFTGTQSVQASWEESRNVVDGAMAEMMQILETPELQEDAAEGELLTRIETILDPVVDFEYVAKRVMGKYYRRASAEQRDTFSGAFRDTLIRTYSKSLAEFNLQRYEMAPEGKPSPKPNKQIVSVYVYSSTGQRYTLVYYMLKQDSGWQAVNVLVDGINLRLNFKNQFADMVSRAKGDVGQVVADWQSLVAIDSDDEKSAEGA